jgi:hypothetical protein
LDYTLGEDGHKAKDIYNFPSTNRWKIVVDMALVHILRGYNQNHPRTWDEKLIYIQHSYNRVVHTLTSKPPFKTYIEGIVTYTFFGEIKRLSESNPMLVFPFGFLG